MLHSAFLLLFMLVGARLASFIPLSALAGVLLTVCWTMAEKKEFALLLRDWRTAIVLLATFGLTIVEDLTVGIVTGCALAAILAVIHRGSPRKATEIQSR
jgi:SulP family sulfate permease